MKMFVHTVFFWLKPETPRPAVDQLVADGLKYLGGIPTVRQIFAGTPAQTPRDVVDNSYGVGLTVIFNDKYGHDLYQVHPLHNDFILRNKQWWRRVQVYDYV